MTPSPPSPTVSRLVTATLIAGALAALLPRLALAFFAFPSADDYCVAAEARDVGFWRMPFHNYMNWTGRYTAMFLESLVVQFDLIAMYRWSAMATLLSTIAAVGALIRSLCARGLGRLPLTAFASIAGAVFTAGLPSAVEAFYWMPGQASYQWGIITYLVWLSLLIRSLGDGPATGSRIWRRTALIVLAIVLPGFNEVMAPLIIATIAAFVMLNRRQAFAREPVLPALLAIVIVMTAVSFMAPGNDSRSGVYPDIPSRHNLEFALLETGRQTVRFIARYGSYPALWFAAFAAWWWGRFLLSPGLGAIGRPGHALAALAGLVPVVYLTLFPVYWEYGEVNFTGEGRTYNVTFVALCAMVVAAVWFALSRFAGVVTARTGPRWANRGRLDLLLAVALAVLVAATPSTLSVVEALGAAPRYLEEEEARAAILRSSPRTGTVFVDAITVRPQGLFWGDIQADPAHWINVCAARYFRLEAVRTRM